MAIFFCCIAVLDPWRFAMPNHLMLFISPIVLLVFFLRHLRRLPHAAAVCASLCCLICGLAISNYNYLSLPAIPQTSSVWEVMQARFGTLSYVAAIIGEALFMMLAISMMLNAMRSRSQMAFEQVKELRHSLIEIEATSAQAIEAAEARVRLMHESLGSDDHDQVRPIEDRFEEQAKSVIVDHIGNCDFGSKALARALGMSERTLGRRTNEILGMTPAALIRHTRLNLARDLLIMRQYHTVAEVAFATGFSSVSHFAKLYRAQFKTTPSETLRSSKLKATAA
jgi:AraC-like DNA-binding protein